MLTVLSFLFALGLLVAVHEYGHYRMALACGVKVLRFSIGFGPILWRRQMRASQAEFVLSAIPLGGYVKMLDEREAPVAPGERHLAFNTRPLRSRVAVVAAGPLANLLLAVLLYACVAWIGIEEPQAILAKPPAQSLAAKAGVQGGERVLRAGQDAEALQDVESFDDLRWLLTQAAIQSHDVQLDLSTDGGKRSRRVTLGLSELAASEVDSSMLRKIGISAPWTRPVIVKILPNGAAQRSGLQAGDLVLRIGGTDITDSNQLVEVIRASVRDGQALGQTWLIERAGSSLELPVTPDVRQDGAAWVGRIDAAVGSRPAVVTVRRGPWDGLMLGVTRTWEMSAVSLQMMGKMLTGSASIKNLSGPLTIADYAGKSASQGITPYLLFLALISVSLGVLNLLPLPVLDGGHLMYYLWEGVTGKPLSEAWTDRLQRGGVALLLVMMSVALFNDVSRLLG